MQNIQKIIGEVAQLDTENIRLTFTDSGFLSIFSRNVSTPLTAPVEDIEAKVMLASIRIAADLAENCEDPALKRWATRLLGLASPRIDELMAYYPDTDGSSLGRSLASVGSHLKANYPVSQP